MSLQLDKVRDDSKTTEDKWILQKFKLNSRYFHSYSTLTKGLHLTSYIYFPFTKLSDMYRINLCM